MHAETLDRLACEAWGFLRSHDRRLLTDGWGVYMGEDEQPT